MNDHLGVLINLYQPFNILLKELERSPFEDVAQQVVGFGKFEHFFSSVIIVMNVLDRFKVFFKSLNYKIFIVFMASELRGNISDSLTLLSYSCHHKVIVISHKFWSCADSKWIIFKESEDSSLVFLNYLWSDILAKEIYLFSFICSNN